LPDTWNRHEILEDRLVQRRLRGGEWGC
jgi:hypothetical protein